MRGTSQQPRGNPRGRPRKRQRGGGRVSEAPIPDPSVFLHYPLTAPTSEASITQQYQPPSTPSTFNGSVTPIPHPTSVMHPAPPSSHVNDTNRGAHSETPQIGATDQAGGPESMTPSLLFQIQNSRSGSSSEDNYMSKTSSPALFYGKLPLPHISAPPSGTASPPPLPNIPNGNSEISLPIYVEKALPVNCEGQRPAARQPSGPLAVTLRKRKAERQAIVDHTTSEDDGGEEESPGVTPQPTLVHQQAPPKAVRGRGRGGRPRGRGRGRGRGTAPTSAATSRDATPALSVRAVAAATGARGGGRGRGKRLRLTHFEEDLDTRSRLPDFEWYTTPEGRCTVQKPAREAMEWPNYKRERALLDRRNQLIQKAPKSRRFLRMVQNRRDELRRLWREGAAALVDFNEEVGKNSYEEVFRSRRIFGETDLGKKTAEDLQVFETKPFSREDDVFKLCQRHQSDTFVAEKLSLEQSTRMLLVEAAERAIRSYLHEGHEDTRDLLAAKIPLIELLICYVTGISDIRAVTINDLRAAFLDQLGHDKTEWDEPQPAIRSNEGLYERTILKTQSAQDRENSIPKLKKAYGELKVGSLRIQVLENGMDWMTWRRNGSVRILPPEPRELDDDMHSKYSNMGEIDKGLTYIILPDDDKDEEKEENDEEMLETYQHEGASAGYVQDWRTDPTNLAQFYQSVGATTIECESINALMTLAMDNGEARAPVPKMESKIQYPYPVNSLCLDRKTRNTRIRDFAIQLPEILMENLRLSITSALDACGSSSDCPAPESSTVGAEVVPTPTKVKHPKPRSKPHPLRQSERASSVESVDTIEDSDDEWETLVRESSSISEYEDEENMAAEKVQEKDEDGVVDEMMVDVEEDVPFVETNVPEPELREDNTEIGENQEVDMIGGSISTVSDGEATATGTGEAERIQGFATVPSAIGESSVESAIAAPRMAITPPVSVAAPIFEPVVQVEEIDLITNSPPPADKPVTDHQSIAYQSEIIEITSSTVASSPTTHNYEIEHTASVITPQASSTQLTVMGPTPFPLAPSESASDMNAGSLEIAVPVAAPLHGEPVTSEIEEDGDFEMVEFDTDLLGSTESKGSSVTEPVRKKRGRPRDSKPNYSFRVNKQKPYRGPEIAVTSRKVKSKGRATIIIPAPVTENQPVVPSNCAYPPQPPNYYPQGPPFGWASSGDFDPDDPHSGWPRRFSGNYAPVHPMVPAYVGPPPPPGNYPPGHASPGHHPQSHPQQPHSPHHARTESPNQPAPPKLATFTGEFFADSQDPDTDARPIITTFRSRRPTPPPAPVQYPPHGGPNMTPYDQAHSPPSMYLAEEPSIEEFDPRLLLETQAPPEAAQHQIPQTPATPALVQPTNTPTPPPGPPAPIGVKYYIGGGKFKIGPPPGAAAPLDHESPTLSNASASVSGKDVSEQEIQSVVQFLQSEEGM